MCWDKEKIHKKNGRSSQLKFEAEIRLQCTRPSGFSELNMLLFCFPGDDSPLKQCGRHRCWSSLPRPTKLATSRPDSHMKLSISFHCTTYVSLSTRQTSVDTHVICRRPQQKFMAKLCGIYQLHKDHFKQKPHWIDENHTHLTRYSWGSAPCHNSCNLFWEYK